MKRVALFAALALSAHAALAQDTSSLAGADRTTALELQQIVDAAKAHGLPVEQIVAKIRYATLVAHAPAPKVIAVAQAVAQRLETARDALAPRPTNSEIGAGADAISLGVTVPALEALRAASPNKPLNVPIGLLAQLVTSHVPIAKATSIVTDLIRRGASSEQLARLGNDVNSDVAVGRKADAALEVRANGLIPLLAPGAGGVNSTMLGPTSTSGDKPKKP